MSETSSRSLCLLALRDSVPIFMGYIPLGIVFGFLFTQAGAAWWLAPVSSLIIYGGASQYMMVPMLSAGLSVGAIAFATLVINLRHIFYGISLLHKTPQRGWKRWYIAFTLTDETFSLLSTFPEGTPHERMLWLAFFDHLWWILGALIGGLIGAQAQLNLAGIDFVLTSLFAVLACEQWRSRKSAWPLWAALGGYALAQWISPDNALSIAIGFCVVAGLVWGTMTAKGSGKPLHFGETR